MSHPYKSQSGRIIHRRSGGQFRRTTLQDFGISQSELADGNMICAKCGHGEGDEKWRPVLKTGYCPKCKSQEKRLTMNTIKEMIDHLHNDEQEQGFVPWDDNEHAVQYLITVFHCTPEEAGEAVAQAHVTTKKEG